MLIQVIERTAPSPTGDIHLGHVYSALTAYRNAKANNGFFKLRIEDIDITRCKIEYENVSNVLINIGGRIGNLMDITQEAINPKSNEGSNITELEKQKIFKAILEVEEKISKLKLSIK